MARSRYTVAGTNAGRKASCGGPIGNVGTYIRSCWDRGTANFFLRRSRVHLCVPTFYDTSQRPERSAKEPNGLLRRRSERLKRVVHGEFAGVIFIRSGHGEFPRDSKSRFTSRTEVKAAGRDGRMNFPRASSRSLAEPVGLFEAKRNESENKLEWRSAQYLHTYVRDAFRLPSRMRCFSQTSHVWTRN